MAASSFATSPITNHQSKITNDLVAWGPGGWGAVFHRAASPYRFVPSYIWQNVLTTFRCLAKRLDGVSLSKNTRQLNTLQTLVLFLGSTRVDKEVSKARYRL